MKLALCIFRYFPYGGLQKDFLRLAETCKHRGYDVFAFCGSDSMPAELLRVHVKLRILPARGWTNHGCAKSFEKQFAEIAAEENFDCIVGFNRMAGLDFYFAGDSCFAERLAHGSFFEKLTFLLPRYRTFLQMENSVFNVNSKTNILTISPAQTHDYIRRYRTPRERFFRVPLGFDPRCRELDAAGIAKERKRMRGELALSDKDFAILLVGSDFKRKGAMRLISAAATLPPEILPRTRVFLVGETRAEPYLNAAAQLGLSNNVFALGGRKDVPALMCAADLLVHPAEEEAGGSVLLEAAATGLPVICTGICGFTPEIERWEGGTVLTHPFRQEDLNSALARRAKLYFSDDADDAGTLKERSFARPLKKHPMPMVFSRVPRSEAIADLLENFCAQRRFSGEPQHGEKK